jgi:hypothetical protein
VKRTYSKPQLVEYGLLEQLTLGSGGSKPDLIFTGSNLISDNTNCSDTGTTYACLVS